MLKKSAYFDGLPDLLVACPELDGTNDSTPVIFEERYLPLASSARASRLPSSDTSDHPAKNRRSSVGRFSPEKVARALKSSLCLDLRHLNKPASSLDDDVYLMASKSVEDSEEVRGSARPAAPDDVHLLTVTPARCISTSPTYSDASSIPPPIYPTENQNVNSFWSFDCVIVSVLGCSTIDRAKFSCGASARNKFSGQCRCGKSAFG
jgi:hypothetical protein